MDKQRTLTHDDYTVLWIAPMEVESVAARLMLDVRHERLGQSPVDHNIYTLGSINDHNVVIASLPETGNTSAATVVAQARNTFKKIRFGLLVGIGGGVPTWRANVHLGDVVVSKPEKDHSGAIQYDHGKLRAGKFERTGYLTPAPKVLLNAAQELSTEQKMRSEDMLRPHLGRIDTSIPGLRKYKYPGAEQDHLYKPEYVHLKPGATCRKCKCDPSQKIDRNTHDSDDEEEEEEEKEDRASWVVVHRGTIAAGETVMKDGISRDELSKETGILCFEMEAAGALNDFPCLIIRGISDYSDTHKNDKWHEYASATAAAYARQLFFHMPVDEVQQCAIGWQGVVQGLSKIEQAIDGATEKNDQHYQRQETRYESEQQRQCHLAFATCNYEEYKRTCSTSSRVPGTCQWARKHEIYQNWLCSNHDDLLWISADPGCGKSVLCRALVDEELNTDGSYTVCHFFFKDNSERNNLATALCALLHQLFCSQPALIKYAMPHWEKHNTKLQSDLSTLWKILSDAGHDENARPIICIVDALDECREDHRVDIVRFLSRFYSRIDTRPRTQAYFKVLVTSRLYDDIDSAFTQDIQDLPAIHLRGDEYNDNIRDEINLVIQVRVAELARGQKLNEMMRERLEEKLLAMQHRTYLWLYLAIEHMRERYAYSLSPDEEEIDSVPSSVEDAYERILARIPPEKRQEATTIFEIVIGARRPFTIHEMAIALGIARRPNAQTAAEATLPTQRLVDVVRRLCGLFVFFNNEKIYLLHQMAKEFLIGESRSNQSHWKHCLQTTTIESTLARICVKFLLFDDIDGGVEETCDDYETDQGDGHRLEPWEYRGSRSRFLKAKHDPHAFGLFLYAAYEWPHYFRLIEVPQGNDLREVLQLYDSTTGKGHHWLDRYCELRYIFDRGRRTSIKMEPIHVAALCGHLTLIQHWSREGILDRAVLDSSGHDALYWASRQRHTDVVKELLASCDDIATNTDGHIKDADIWEAIATNVIICLSSAGEIELVKSLLSKGVGLGSSDRKLNQTLSEALDYGLDDLAQMMINHGAGPREFAFVKACGKGTVIFAKKLLETGVDVNARDVDDYTGLHKASDSYRDVSDIVKMLLDKNGNIHARVDNGDTALHLASREGNIEVARMLLEAGARINARNECGNTALHHACRRAKEAVVSMLLEYGADVDAGNLLSRTPLYHALRGPRRSRWPRRQRMEVAQALLAHGANRLPGLLEALELQPGPTFLVDSLSTTLENAGRGRRDQGPKWGLIHIFTIADRSEGVKNLIHASESDDEYPNDGQNLVRTSQDIDETDNQGWTALHWAAYLGHVKTARVLVERGANRELADGQGWTPYKLALSSKFKPTYCDIDALDRKAAFTASDDRMAILDLLSPRGLERSLPRRVPSIDAMCDVCGKDPMIGYQYHCTVCQDYDLCFRCYREVDDIHPYHDFDDKFRYRPPLYNRSASYEIVRGKNWQLGRKRSESF